MFESFKGFVGKFTHFPEKYEKFTILTKCVDPPSPIFANILKNLIESEEQQKNEVIGMQHHLSFDIQCGLGTSLVTESGMNPAAK